MSSIDLTERSTLTRKAHSLDDLVQVGISSQPIVPIRISPATTNYQTDEEDDNDESVQHTRL